MLRLALLVLMLAVATGVEAYEFCVELGEDGAEACAEVQELREWTPAPYPGVSEKTHRVLGYTMIAAVSADLVSTEIGLATCGSCYEAHPILGNTGARWAIRGGVGALAWYASEKLRRAGRDRVAFWIRLVGTAVGAGATVNNAIVASR